VWYAGVLGGNEDAVEVDVSTASTRTITQVVTAFGRSQPEVEVTISPDVSGEIVELPVQEGDQVQEGDLLARLNPDNYRAQVERQRAEVSSARATLSERKADSLQAKLQFDRQAGLFEKEVISEADYETARSQYQQAVARLEAARFRVESTEASLRDAEEALERTRLYAPMDGTVSKLDVELGERVVGTTQMQGTEMMRIARLDQMEVEVDVNENDVVNVALSDSAAVEIDAYPDRQFRGRVTEIANSARVSGEGTQEQVTNFPVKIRILDSHNLGMKPASAKVEGGVRSEEIPTPPQEAPILRPGMSGTVDVFTQTVTDVVAVPIQSVTVRDFNAEKDKAASDLREEDLRKVVFVADADSARMVEVTTGISDDTHIEVRSGLAGGERVVIGPYSAVSREIENGTRIKVSTPGDDEDEGVLATSE